VRRPASNGRWGLASILLAVFLGACQTYTPVTNPVPGSTVRVRVPVTSAVANPNAAPQTLAVEGTVVESGDTLVLATTNRQEYGAYREIVQFDTVRLAPDQQYSVEVVEFSVRKSIVLGLVLTGAAALAASAAFGVGGADDAPIPGNPPPPQGALVISSSLIAGIIGLLGGG
jgi:predicted component of type VI protein secretion system